MALPPERKRCLTQYHGKLRPVPQSVSPCLRIRTGISCAPLLSAVGVAEASYLMKNMIEFSPQFLYAIFFLMALGFVILTLPLGIWFTELSRKMAVKR